MNMVHKIFKKKNQGQSTVEYMLVILLASVLVLILALQFSRPFKETLSRFEDQLVAKLEGGKLLNPPEEGKLSGGTGGATEVALSAGASGEGEGVTGGGGGGGRRGGGSGSQATSESAGLLTTEKLTSKSEEGGDEFEGSVAPSSSGGASSSGIWGAQGQRGAKKSKTTEDATKTVEQKKESKEQKDFKKRKIYKEGEEEAVFETTQISWLKIFIIILIIVVVAYIIFELYQATRVRRR